jgi:large subunit ribosomal protein L10
MRPEKVTIVSDINAKLKSSPFLLIADYGGMKVTHFEELRKRLGGAGATCSVVKNTFLKIAIKELGLPELNGALNGQTAMITGESDIAATAKILKTFVSEFEKPVLKVGILDNAVLDAAQIKALADLPSKEVLQATLLGVLLAPATKLVRVFNEPGASLARVLKAKADAAGGQA